MNITLIKLKSVVVELRGIRQELARLADCWEAELAQQGYNMHVPKVDSSGPDPTVEYVDEAMDWARETIDRLKQEDLEKDRNELEP